VNILILFHLFIYYFSKFLITSEFLSHFNSLIAKSRLASLLRSWKIEILTNRLIRLNSVIRLISVTLNLSLL
jgi:hypothetical protein